MMLDMAVMKLEDFEPVIHSLRLVLNVVGSTRARQQIGFAPKEKEAA